MRTEKTKIEVAIIVDTIENLKFLQARKKELETKLNILPDYTSCDEEQELLNEIEGYDTKIYRIKSIYDIIKCELFFA